MHLTPAGREARAQAHETTEAFEARLTSALGISRHQPLTELLEYMRTIIREIEPAD